ncbi:MAG: hypothetical protein VX255_08645, partial [Candidatus Latescibacterota bacterium]|nr:hypothetical protein [Candidatus Latescibacterota bacterium]
ILVLFHAYLSWVSEQMHPEEVRDATAVDMDRPIAPHETVQFTVISRRQMIEAETTTYRLDYHAGLWSDLYQSFTERVAGISLTTLNLLLIMQLCRVTPWRAIRS